MNHWLVFQKERRRERVRKSWYLLEGQLDINWLQFNILIYRAGGIREKHEYFIKIWEYVCLLTSSVESSVQHCGWIRQREGCRQSSQLSPGWARLLEPTKNNSSHHCTGLRALSPLSRSLFSSLLRSIWYINNVNPSDSLLPSITSPDPSVVGDLGYLFLATRAGPSPPSWRQPSPAARHTRSDGVESRWEMRDTETEFDSPWPGLNTSQNYSGSINYEESYFIPCLKTPW